MQEHFTPPQKELQLKIKPLMTEKLKSIAKREGVDPTALVLLQVARLINEKEDEEKYKV